MNLNKAPFVPSDIRYNSFEEPIGKFADIFPGNIALSTNLMLSLAEKLKYADTLFIAHISSAFVIASLQINKSHYHYLDFFEL